MGRPRRPRWALPLGLQKRQAVSTKPSHGKVVIYEHYAIFPSESQAVFEKKQK